MSAALPDLILPERLPAPIVTCTIEGILDEEDLRALALGGELALAASANGEAPPPLHVEPEDPSDLKKIREKHHSVARAIASGLPQRMVARIAGYTESYLSILLNSPAIKELVELYRIKQGAAAEIISEKLRTVAGKALERLEEKIDGGEVNTDQLLAAAKLGFDRTGHGPQSKQHVVNETHVLDHAKIAELNREARRRSAALIVPVQEVRAALAPPPSEATE